MNYSWLFKTIGIGAIPLVIRIIACFLTGKVECTSLWHPIDFIFFGLTISLSCILQLSSLKNSVAVWNRLNAFLIWIVIVIVLLTFELGALYINEMLSKSFLKESTALWTTVFMVVVSLMISFVFVKRLSEK